MKRLFLTIFLLTATMILADSQIVRGQPLDPGPELLWAAKCPNNNVCPDNIAPRLEWLPGSYSFFKVCIYLVLPGTTITEKCTTSPNSHKLIHCDDSITTGAYQVPKYILKTNTKYQWTVCALDENKNEITKFTTSCGEFETLSMCQPGNGSDQDCDGITNKVEEKLGTSPEKKTLFVRPKKQKKGGEFEYWKEFIVLFPGDPRSGFAKIPQFEKAGIEIVVIGAQGHVYKNFNNLDYNPATPDNTSGLPDGEKLPCNIMEIQLIMEKDTCNSRENDYCYCPNDDACECEDCKNVYNYKGHTNFGEIQTYINNEPEKIGTWSWDTKGYLKSKIDLEAYGTPRLFDFPLENYFTEGAYQSIGKDAEPKVPVINNEVHCNHANDVCNELSPANLIDPLDRMNPISPPFIKNPLYPASEVNTVEFTPIEYYDSNQINENNPNEVYKKGQIKDLPAKIFFVKEIKKIDMNTVRIEQYNGVKIEKPIVIDRGVERDRGDSVFYVNYDTAYIKPYTKDDGLRRTIVHEMGHALMMGSDSDHCSNPQCIMYENFPQDWEPRDFGSRRVDKDGNTVDCCSHNSLYIGAAVYNTPPQ